MKPVFKTACGRLYQGDCLEILKSWKDNNFTTVITDPPYELGFMGKKWDSSGVAFQIETWKEVLRVCKPGAIMLAFGGTRTHHRLMCAIEDAGWEIRDVMMWLYGSGFPKSLDISKAIDKAAGVKREVGPVDSSRAGRLVNQKGDYKTGVGWSAGNRKITIDPPATTEAQLWDGYGTALKPAYEPIIVAMKPLDGTFANNALSHGVAGLNIDAGRIFREERDTSGWSLSGSKESENAAMGGKNYSRDPKPDNLKGRWPANIILDEEAGAILDEQGNYISQGMMHPDTGRASRFYYCPKASKPERGESNTHPTVKPITLIEYLVGLVAPPKDAKILDPFIGSGTLGVICEELETKYVGIDLDCSIATNRIGETIPSTGLFRKE